MLVLDEATANLDADTDARIQRLLRRDLSGTTLLTIAHRLQTIIDYDTLLVMGSGKLLEQGSPTELLGLDGAFASIVRAVGPAGEADLRRRAHAAAGPRASMGYEVHPTARALTSSAGDSA